MTGEHVETKCDRSTDPVTVIDRLRMRYATGPMVNGEPEFGWRDFSGPAPEGCMLPTPLMLEAANEIERLTRERQLIADEFVKRADWLRSEWRNGGNFEHLKAREDECRHLAEKVRKGITP